MATESTICGHGDCIVGQPCRHVTDPVEIAYNAWPVEMPRYVVLQLQADETMITISPVDMADLLASAFRAGFDAGENYGSPSPEFDFLNIERKDEAT